MTTEYPPFYGGGISTYCFHSAKMFAGMGASMTILVPDDSITNYTIRTDADGVRVIRFNSSRSGSRSFLGYTARLSYEFALLVRLLVSLEGSPDIIEAQDYLGIAYYLLQFKYLLYEDVKNIPVIITLHSPAFLYLEYNRVPVYRFPDFWTCEMEKQSLKMADQLISPTQFMADAIQSYVGINSDKISIIRNPFSRSPVKVSAFLKNRIVYYGKLSPQKGSFELLACFKKLWDGGFGHPLHIIGRTDIVYHPEQLTMGQLVGGQYKDYIKKGLLVMNGPIKPADQDSALKNAHVLIVPSIVDNLPYVVMEGMSLGKLVLASVQGGQQEIIDDGIDGFLFDHSVPGHFESRLLYILSLSDAAVSAIAAAAMQKIRSTCDPFVIAGKKQTLLTRLLGNSFPSRHFPFIFQEQYIPMAEPATNAPNTLTVVIPYYNMGKYIHECIGSVLASSYPGIEIIIVDDGSDDPQSMAALEQLGKNSRIIVYRKQNEGLAETRNFGAERATGEFLAFLDADDTVKGEYYTQVIRVLQQYENVFFAGSWVNYFGKTSVKTWAAFTPQPPYLLVHNSVNSSGLVYKRQAFLKSGYNDKKVDYGLEDYESVIHLMANGFNGIVLPESLFNYRVRRDSMFRKVTTEKLLYSYKYIIQKHSVYYAKFATGIANLLNANGPGFMFDNPTIGVTVFCTPERTKGFLVKLRSIVKKNRTLKKIALKIIKYTNI